MDYQLLDSGEFSKLENVGGFRIIRPAAAAVWKRRADAKLWRQVDAVLTRKSGGEGEWNINNPKLKEPWSIDILKMKIEMRLTGFGHLGLFAEQHQNWAEFDQIVRRLVKQNSTKPKVLNLFAYTGIASLACARAGAEVVHVDASKTSVAWARRNAELSGLKELPIRWIIEDVNEFVSREKRRGNKYEGIILDPPSFGRGHKSQLWKIETDMVPLLTELSALLSPDHSFVSLSSHTPGYTPIALKNLLEDMLGERAKAGTITAREMTLTDTSQRELPSGACATFQESL